MLALCLLFTSRQQSPKYRDTTQPPRWLTAPIYKREKKQGRRSRKPDRGKITIIHMFLFLTNPEYNWILNKKWVNPLVQAALFESSWGKQYSHWGGLDGTWDFYERGPPLWRTARWWGWWALWRTCIYMDEIHTSMQPNLYNISAWICAETRIKQKMIVKSITRPRGIRMY